MRTKAKYLVLLWPLLLLALAGCCTGSVWMDDETEAWNEPAGKPNLQLFQEQPQTNLLNLLVVYDESSERNNSIHSRAYWLNQNQSRVSQRRRPHFTNRRAGRHFPAVPVFYDPPAAGTNLPAGLCAVVATNHQSFTLFLDSHPIASHDLPVYNDGKGRIEKIALTPLAVTVDATVVGSVIAYFWAGGGYQDPRKPAIGAGPYN